LASNAEIPMHKHMKYEKKKNQKQGNMIPTKVNNSTVIDTNDSEVDENSKNSKK
jgi:hypothetical protein